MSRTTAVPPTPCPKCGHNLDRAADLMGDSTPQPGDLTLCIECGTLLRFTDDMTLRTMSPQEEWNARRVTPGIALLERAYDAMRKENPR